MIHKNIIIIILIAIIIVMGGFFVFSNIQNNSGFQPKILILEEEWDFGKVIQGEKPTHVFILKNEGEEDLLIEGIKESCACIEATISTTLVQSGELAELIATYDTTDYEGKDEKHIHIYSNDPREPDKRIDLFIEIETIKAPYLDE